MLQLWINGQLVLLYCVCIYLSSWPQLQVDIGNLLDLLLHCMQIYVLMSCYPCSFKRVSPSAYCDCSEKCSCRSLCEGLNSSRLELFKLLLDHTNLASYQNARYVVLLLLLIASHAIVHVGESMCLIY